jgi:AraC family transcriptional regulator
MAGSRAHRSLPAIEAFQHAIHVRPVALREARDFVGSTISVWTTGKLGEYEIPPMREPMIALHTGGVPRFQTRLGDRWTEPSLPGQVYWIPADLPTVWRVNGPLEFVAVHFGEAALARVASGAGISAREAARLPFRPGFHDAFASSACTLLAQEACRPPARPSSFAERLADTLAVYLVQQRDGCRRGVIAAEGSAVSLLEKALDRIEASIASGVSVEALARAAGMSPSRFAHAFRRATGTSPHRYLTARRIDLAKHLLERTSFPLAEIALETGFSSQAHFTLRFREQTGQTPLEFRLGSVDSYPSDGPATFSPTRKS